MSTSGEPRVDVWRADRTTDPHFVLISRPPLVLGILLLVVPLLLWRRWWNKLNSENSSDSGRVLFEAVGATYPAQLKPLVGLLGLLLLQLSYFYSISLEGNAGKCFVSYSFPLFPSF